MNLVRRIAWLALATLLTGEVGCTKQPEIIVKTAGGQAMTADQVDSKPLLLLPAGAVGWLHVDRVRAAQTALGQRVLRLLTQRLPLPSQTGLDLGRDVQHVFAANFTTTGPDFVAVLSGVFDRSRLEASVAPGSLSMSPYSGHSLFSVPGLDLGLVVLTPKTALLGTRAALHRTLDRISDQRVEDSLPPWVSNLLNTPGSAVAVGFAPGSTPLSGALHRQAGFLKAIVTAQLLANFEGATLNGVGTLTHVDHASAKLSASGILSLGQVANLYGRMLGLSRPLRKLETQAVDNDTRFAISVSEAAVDRGLQAIPAPFSLQSPPTHQ